MVPDWILTSYFHNDFRRIAKILSFNGPVNRVKNAKKCLVRDVAKMT